MHNLRLVVAWMAGALISFSALAVSVRELSGRLTVFEILALRALGGIVVLGIYAMIARQRIGPPRPLRIHLLRNVFHFGGQAGWAFGLTLLPLATVFALEFTTPAWTMVLAVLFLGETLTRGRIAAVVLGFVGVLVILRPGAGSFQPAALLVLMAAVMFAVQLTTTKFLTGTNSVLTILFWMNVMHLPMYLAANALTAHAPVDAQVWDAIWFAPKFTLVMLPWLVVLCVAGLLAHVCVTNAFRHGDAMTVVPVDFLRIPVIAMVGVVMYHEQFDVLVLVGAAISAAGIVWSLSEKRHSY
jgi:drug/metabolite transporter (DMT)-like permease